MPDWKPYGCPRCCIVRQVGGLLVSVMAHGAPAEDQVGGGFAVLAREHAGRGIPPPDCPIGVAEGGEQGTVDGAPVAGQPARPGGVAEHERADERCAPRPARRDGSHRAALRRTISHDTVPMTSDFTGPLGEIR